MQNLASANVALEEMALSVSTCVQSPIISMYRYLMHQRPAMMTDTLQQKLHMVRTVQAKTSTVRLEMTFPLPAEKERLCMFLSTIIQMRWIWIGRSNVTLVIPQRRVTRKAVFEGYRKPQHYFKTQLQILKMLIGSKWAEA